MRVRHPVLNKIFLLNTMTTANDREDNGPGWREFWQSLKWLEAEGYIELFYDANGEETVRIAEGAEGYTL